MNDETGTIVAMSATELADAIGVDPKAFRSFYRKYAKAHGLSTPGSGGRYKFNVRRTNDDTPDDVTAWGEAYADHARTHGAVVIDGAPIV